MEDAALSKEELLDQIRMLKIKNARLKQKIDSFVKEDKIYKKYNIDSSVMKTILDAMPSAVAIINANEQKFSYLNQRAMELYGVDYLGQDLESHSAKIHATKPDGTPYPNEEMPVFYSLLYGREVRNKNMIMEKQDGTKIPIMVSTAPIFDSDGKVTAAITIFDDVTTMMEYEDKLKKSEEKYRYLFDAIDKGFAILEVMFDKENNPLDYKIVELNPAYEKQTGLLRKDVLGKTASQLHFDPEKFWVKKFGRVAVTGESASFVHKSKSLNKWFRVNAFKITIEKNCSKVGVLFTDVTEDVNYTNRMEELIKMQDDLYVNVSHELKTPLNVIFSANQMMDVYLKEGLTQDNMEKLLTYNTNIKQNCYRLTKLINNIVDLSKSNSGLLKLNLTNVNIVSLIENIVESISEYVNSKHLKIIFDTNAEEKIMACDQDKIERVMLNLISNAIKFSNTEGQIFVNLICRDDTVEISVKDTGIGIEKRNLDNIFKKFFQENKNLHRNTEGTGIGLSLIKSLVELHGGKISVESQVNKGSTFKVVLPAKTIKSHEIIDQADPYENKIETIKIEFSDIYSI